MVFTVLNIATQGLNANKTAVRNSAHNIANATTDNADLARTSFSSQNTGVRASTDIVQAKEGEYADLANELVNLKVQEKNFSANAAVIEAADDMTEALLDIEV